MSDHSQQGWGASPPPRSNWSPPGWSAAPPGWHPPRATPPGGTPSGLFPSRPARPTYREAHRVRPGAVAAGLGAGALWFLVFGLLGHDVRGFAWWTVVAGGAAWLVALLLARQGDRGVAVGLAVTTALGWSIAATAVAVRWAITGDWPLW
jgi:hypothetical protein